jgi:hypothetical protein
MVNRIGTGGDVALRGCGDVEVDVDVEEAVEVDGTPSPPAAGEPVALVLMFEIKGDTRSRRNRS